MTATVRVQSSQQYFVVSFYFLFFPVCLFPTFFVKQVVLHWCIQLLLAPQLPRCDLRLGGSDTVWPGVVHASGMTLAISRNDSGTAGIIIPKDSRKARSVFKKKLRRLIVTCRSMYNEFTRPYAYIRLLGFHHDYSCRSMLLFLSILNPQILTRRFNCSNAKQCYTTIVHGFLRGY